MLEEIQQLKDEIAGFASSDLAEIEQFRIRHLSKKGTIATLFEAFA